MSSQRARTSVKPGDSHLHDVGGITGAPYPGAYQAMHADQPRLMAAYEALGAACAESGPLDVRTIALVKLAISVGAGLEGAAHSHCRKALDAGCTKEELLHVAQLCAPTIGFPPMMRGRQWVMDVVNPEPPVR